MNDTSHPDVFAELAQAPPEQISDENARHAGPHPGRWQVSSLSA